MDFIRNYLFLFMSLIDTFVVIFIQTFMFQIIMSCNSLYGVIMRFLCGDNYNNLKTSEKNSALIIRQDNLLHNITKMDNIYVKMCITALIS